MLEIVRRQTQPSYPEPLIPSARTRNSLNRLVLPSSASHRPLTDWQLVTNKFQVLAINHPLSAKVLIGGLVSLLDRLNGCFPLVVAVLFFGG